MKIKTGSVRRVFDGALNNNTVDKNMLLMSLASLNEQIDHNDKVSDTKAAKYITMAKTIAMFAISKGISNQEIQSIINNLSSERYPSEPQIIKLVSVIKSSIAGFKYLY